MALGDRVIFVAEGTAYEVVQGEGGPVEAPPTRTPETEEPTVEPTRPAEPTAEPTRPADPTATPDTGGGTGPTGTGGGLCSGAVAMGLAALAAAGVWVRTNGGTLFMLNRPK
jgi:hypothetical protein